MFSISKNIKIGILIISFLVFIFIIFAFNKYINRRAEIHREISAAFKIKLLLFKYIESNGRFPESLENLTKYDSNEITGFEKFSLMYGVDVSDIEEADSKLFNKLTKEQLFLFYGPNLKELNDLYENGSLDLYKTMLREKQKTLENQ